MIRWLFNKMLFLTIFVAIFCLCGVSDAQRNRRQGYNVCRTPNNYYGLCVALPNCPSLVNYFGQSGGSQTAYNFLIASQRSCGTRRINNEPAVCCEEAYNRQVFTTQPTRSPVTFPPTFPPTQPPTRPPTFPPTLPPTQPPTLPPTRPPTVPPTIGPTSATISPKSQTECRGPDLKSGTCTHIAQCPALLDRLLANPNDQEYVQFIRLSNDICAGDRVVCCPIDSSPIVTPSTPTERTTNVMPQFTLPTPGPTPYGCGASNFSQSKIVGGEPARLGSFPWIALLGYAESSGSIGFKCGGSLITNQHVLTAAHCINSALRTVRLGEHDLSMDSETGHIDVNIRKVERHAKYDRKDGHSDIAILYLEKPVEFTDLIHPVCLPIGPDYKGKNLVGYNPFVAGWGKTQEGGQSAQELQQLQIPILENEVCKAKYQAQRRLLSEKQFNDAVYCAGFLNGGKDSCQGDSGGPLMLPKIVNRMSSFTLIGVVSYGIGCARVDVPGVYTNVGNFIDWIQTKIAEA